MKTPATAFVFSLLIIAYTILFMVHALYPFIDLPNHLAEATIFKFSSHTVFANFYSVRGGIEPNSLHYLFCSMFDSVEQGNKVYYVLYAILLPLTTTLVIVQQGGNWKLGFLSLLLIFNYNVSFGFAGFTMAIPFILFSFYLLGRDSLPTRIALAGMLIVLFFTHVLGLLFMLFLIITAAVVKANSFKGFLKQGWVIVPSLLLIFSWQTHAFSKDQSTAAFLIEYYTTSYFPSLYLRGKLFIYDNFVLAQGLKGIILALLFFLVIFIPVLLKLWNLGFKGIANFTRVNKLAVTFFVVSFTCCFFLPGELPGQGILYQRFSVFLLISFIIIASLLYKDSISKVWQTAFLTIIVLHGVLWYDYFSDFNKQNKAFDAAFFYKVPRHEPMGGVMIDYNYRGRPVYIHFANYHIVWNEGIATTKVIDYRFGSIKRVAPTTVLPEYQEWAGTAGLIPKEYATLKYLLLRGDALNLPRHAPLLASDGEWKIVKLN